MFQARGACGESESALFVARWLPRSNPEERFIDIVDRLPPLSEPGMADNTNVLLPHPIGTRKNSPSGARGYDPNPRFVGLAWAGSGGVTLPWRGFAGSSP